ncbi:MAG TPA: tetrahydrofolate dehydrogenase/cyclohydrolase catalytic domain-containing protein [Candidatus Saccharicenans sp.]|jgi:methylenetetrahydrofolate dehydrogenase (NADP+)/methenyltetrahydrofolate cyclohydrolase|nr:tetrahydrofolate dehydrogenase/cyclohydrolase catalytic domain-containing protein [Candidatus Saccharicenans sp.]HOL45816.1 tetrahydrofolate dehydrogenase/cyclohydrolase catalytic domain-containing protein [Candidatus Saccharicenans sp.]HOM93970.1 tetrahydrofolate dehydrogenase/cyclohydrolase catalytic domain-containing protein [Candidatus Saccharicenans sp.]HPP24502.1 tetrahydrofolate dehydrogenase/cyclohydrolase catalytic domain-containing protein [Candidatus Saccharicenans sp.]HRT25172.1 
MPAKIISGKEVAAAIREELKLRAQKLKEKGVVAGLGVILVGEDPASVSYVTAKAKAAEEIGIFEETVRLPGDASEEEILKNVDRLNRDQRFHGVLVQLPLPKWVNPDKVINFISPEKDVDGFHPVNVGKLLRGEPCPLPCTPYGIQQMLVRSGYSPEGQHVVICGRSNIVGKPLAALLMQKKPGANATVTVCHTGTRDIKKHTLQADILVAAMGAPRVITADMVREGCVVIDVGVNRVPDPAAAKGFRLVGDCDFEPIKEKAAAITPVPGGVGPMTVTMLMMNTIEAAERTLQ